MTDGADPLRRFGKALPDFGEPLPDHFGRVEDLVGRMSRLEKLVHGFPPD